MRFIRKVGDGEVNLEQIEKEKQTDPKNVADIWSADFASAWVQVGCNLNLFFNIFIFGYLFKSLHIDLWIELMKYLICGCFFWNALLKKNLFFIL